MPLKRPEKTCGKCVHWDSPDIVDWQIGACYYVKFPMWFTARKENSHVSPMNMQTNKDATDCNCFERRVPDDE